VGEPAEEEPVDDGPEALIGAWPGAAAVHQAGPAGVRVEPDSEVLADVGDVLRRRRRARADRPHRLVCDDDLFPGGDVEQRFQLRETPTAITATTNKPEAIDTATIRTA
jgi:hypothetical protein